ncbi:hypothetical protein Tco_1118033 [Tanacetum coccineum]
MTKVIKGEFEKLEDLNDEDFSLTCGTSLKVFNKEFNWMCIMDDDLFTYEVKVANIPCDSNKDDDTRYDPSDVAFTEWLGSKKFNYKTMDHYTKKTLWIYWIRGDDEVELTDEEFSDNEEEVAEVFRINTNIFNFETPMCKTFKEFNYLLQIDPDLLRTLRDSILMKNIRMIGYMNGTEMYHGLMRNPGLTLEFRLIVSPSIIKLDVKHYCKPFNYKTGCSKWPTCSWKNDGYYNGGNLLGAYIVRNSLHYQDYEWIQDDEEEYVDVKEDEYDDLTITSDEACRAYQEIFWMMDEGWMVRRNK